MGKSQSGCGCVGCLVVVLAFLAIRAVSEPTMANWAWLLGVIALAVLAAFLGTPTRCKICGNALKRVSFNWKLEGKKYMVCSHCNNRLEREQSRQAMKRFKR